MIYKTKLDLLERDCNKWELEVNTEKKVNFRRRNDLYSNKTWTYKGNFFEIRWCIYYLDTVFNCTGNFALNQETLVGSGLKACIVYCIYIMLCVSCLMHLLALYRNILVSGLHYNRAIFFKFWKNRMGLGENSMNGATVTSSRKLTYIILTPLNPVFYIVKLGFTGVYSTFLIPAQK